MVETTTNPSSEERNHIRLIIMFVLYIVRETYYGEDEEEEEESAEPFVNKDVAMHDITEFLIRKELHNDPPNRQYASSWKHVESERGASPWRN